jgi:dTDP-6-deoxy-L-talose 4-dehydrogenase (NAD+)
MKTILLTGASGFVGKQIFEALSASNFRIVPVVRTGKESSFQNQPNADRIVCSPDIFQESAGWWTEQCKDIDIVIHAAWYAEPGKYLQSSKNMDCLVGSLNLARGAAIAGVKRFVGIGTCFEYDLSAGVLSTDTPLNPLTPYAGAKAALYIGLSQWLPEQSVEFGWSRLFYLYGEGEDERRLVPYLHKQLAKGEAVELTSGTQIRDFLDVSEAGRIIAELALGKQLGPINVCSGVPITVRQLAEQIADTYGRRDLLKFGARPDNLVDPPCVLGTPNHGVAEKAS